MLTERRISLALVVSMVLIAGAVAQEERPPSFTERLSRFGRGLFDRTGGDEPPPRTTGFEDASEPSDYSSEMPARRPLPPTASPPQPRGTMQQPSNQYEPTTRSAQAAQPNGATRARAPQASASEARSSRRTAQPGFANQAPTGSPPSGRTSSRATSDPVPPNPWGSEPVARDSRSVRGDLDASIAPSPPLVSQSEPDPIDVVPRAIATEPAPIQPKHDPVAQRSLQGRLEKARDPDPAEQPEYAPQQSTVTKSSPSGATVSDAPKSRIARATPTGRDTLPSASAANASSQQTLFEQQGPVLRVHASGPQRIKVGTVSAYTLTIENSGNMQAEEVVVAVRIPDSADVANIHAQDGSARPNSGADGSPLLEWSIPRLASGARSELTVGLIPRKNEPFELTAAWTHAPVGSLAAIEVQEAKLVMSLTGPEEVFFGEREIYKLTLSNPGNGDAENVLVRLLPTTPSDEQAVSHQIGTLAAGENRVVELELTARQVGTLRLKAEAIADGGLLTSVDEEVLVRRADLKIDMEGPSLLYAGTVGVYRMHVSNPGNAIAKNVQISAVLPAGASFIDCSDGGVYSQEHGRIVWTTSNLRPGAAWSCSYRCELNHPGMNTAQITGIADGDLRQVATAETEVEALADLTLSVKDPPGPMPVGDDVIYEVRVKNRGTKAAEGVEIVAFFSPGIEPVDVEGGPYEVGPGQIALAPIAALNPGQEMLFKIRARAHRSGTHVFRAEVECPALETKLAAEETTRFYGEQGARTSGRNWEPNAQRADEEEAPLVPVPSTP